MNKKTSRFAVLILFLLLILGATFDVYSQGKTKLSDLDIEIEAGLKSVGNGDWSGGRQHFQKALELHDKSNEASPLLISKIDVPDEDGKPLKGDFERQLMGYRHSMATNQGLLQFVAYCYQLEGDTTNEEAAIERVYGIQSVGWGLSWKVFIPLMDGIFRSSLPKTKKSNYSRYLFGSGILILNAGHEQGLESILAAFDENPRDPEISAELASIYIVRLEAELVRKYAAASLAVKPEQGRLLIDLATADWLLGDLTAARRNAAQASKYEPDLPGPHATLALVAIEESDNETAIKEADTGVRLSNGHVFYVTIQAIALESSGKSKQAEQLIKKAWGDDLPDEDKLKAWFFRGKPLELLLGIIDRAKK